MENSHNDPQRKPLGLTHGDPDPFSEPVEGSRLRERLEDLMSNGFNREESIQLLCRPLN